MDLLENLSVIQKFIAVAGVSSLTSFALFFASSYWSERLSKSYRESSIGLKGEWDSRVVSNVHAIVTCSLALYCFKTDPRLLNMEILYSTTPGSLTMAIMTGYLAYDLIICLRYVHTMSSLQATLIHHLIGSITFVFAVKGQSFIPMGLYYVFTEISTPFINLRWFFDVCGVKTSPLVVINGALMALAFLFVRIIPAPLIGYRLWSQPDELRASWGPYGVEIAFVLFSAMSFLNTYWFFLIAKGLIKKINQMKLSSKKLE